jgi:uncharacterized protein
MADPTNTSVTTRFDGFVPERAQITAYGNGGFRFAGMSHRGSLLVLPDGTHAWAMVAPSAPADLTPALMALLAKLEEPQFLLVGTGRKQIFADPSVRAAFGERRIGLDVMDTGAACRTYNILLAEQRAVMLAVVAVD